MSYSDWLQSVRLAAIERLLERAGMRPHEREPGDSRSDASRSGTTRRAAHHAGAGQQRKRISLAERLEARLVLSAAVPIASPPITVTPIASGPVNNPSVITPNATAPYTPANIQGAYGVSSIAFQGVSGTGAGQTIAIIDAYNDPNIVSDAATFNSYFNLPQFNTTGNPTFTVLNETGGTSLPANATTANGGWDTEESLDVEWAHSIAPMANIILFEANTASGDLYTAAATAAAYPGVSVVSMSFGGSEFSSEHSYDSTFTTPSGHQGVTFLASTGDNNAPAEYPAYSPNVVAVGGTTLTISGTTTWAGETAWGNVSSGSGGGGGISSYESQPSYQAGNVNGLSTTKRTAPDVSMLANVSTGVYMYDSWAGGADNGGYYIAGGTSLACPMWAGLVAIADQDRVLAGQGTLDGVSQTLPRLYELPSTDFHDITSGNNGYNAGTGYDLATGIGSPIANLLVPALAGVTPTAAKLSFAVSPTSATAGTGISPTITVDVMDSFGDLVTTDSSSVTLSIGNNPGSATLGGTLTATAVNGVATFSGISLNKVGTAYTLTAADGSLTIATSGSFNITAGSASQVIISHQPGSGTVGVALSPAVTVTVEDAYGNIVTSGSTVVSLALSTGGAFASGATINVSTVSGVATFSNLIVATAGNYTFTASDGSLTTASTSSFAIAMATPVVGVADAGGTYNGSSFGATSGFANDANTGANIVTFGSGLLSYSYYAGTLTTSQQVAGATPLGAVPIAAGAYTIVAAFAGNSNYNAASSAPVNFTIAQRALHVTAAGQNKTYNNSLAGTVTLSDDRVSGDSLTLTYGSAVFADKNVNTGIGVSVSGISMSGSSAANYTLANTTAATTANITALTINGSFTASNKTYDNTTSATIATRSLSGVLGSDSVTMIGGTGTFNSKDVATATTVTASGFSLSGAQAGDYSLGNPTETASASIAALGINGSISAGNKVYDGTTSATISTRNLAGVLGSDAVSLIGGTASFNSATVDDANTVTATGLSLTGAQASDYSLNNPTETAGASITPLAITGSFTVSNKTYDRTLNAVIATRSLTGVLGSDDVSLTGGSGAYNSKDVATATMVTASGFTLAGADSDNYSLGNPTETASGSITALAISGSVVGINKTYDDTTAATFSPGTFTGVCPGDTVTLVGGSASFNSKDVGSANTITVTSLSLGGAQAGDYTLGNPTETAAASINPLGITGSITAASKVYDGTTAGPTISNETLTGFFNGDAVSLTGGTATFNSKNVGTATTVTDTGLSLTGAQAGDYSLSNPTETASAGITAAPITGSIVGISRVYNGNTAATYSSGTLTGVFNSDAVVISGGTAAFNSKDVGTATTITVTGLSLSGAAAGDYSLSNTTETTSASISALGINGSITASGKTYDNTASASIATRSLTGVISDDDVSLVGGSATFNSSQVQLAATVTATGLTLSGAQAGDYSLNNPTETASAAIAPLGITGSFTSAGKTYDGGTSAAISTRSLTGVLGSDAVSLTGGTGAFNSKDVASATTVTASGFTLGGGQAADYTLSNPTESASATITPLGITGAIVANSKTYDATPAATLKTETLTGVIGSDSVWLVAGVATFNSVNVSSATTVSANCALAGPQAPDYSLGNPSETASASISPLAIAATITAQGKTYDGTTAAVLTGESLSGVLNSDDVSVSGGTATFNTKDAGTSKTVTASGLTLSGAQASDYTLAGSTAATTATITPLSITGSFTAAGKTYDGTVHATISGTALTGKIGSDAVTLSTAGATASFDTKDVGTGKTVTATGLALSGAQAADYTLANATETTTANITPLAITGTVTAAGKVYDSTTAATVTGRSLTGVKAGDDVSLVGGSAAFNSKDVSSATTVAVTGLSIAGAQAGDYTLANPTETASARITPFSVTGVITAASKTYDGTTAATIGGSSVIGLYNNDAVTLVIGNAAFDTRDVGTGKTVTAGNLTLGGAQAADYSLSNPSETAIANITPLTITGSISASSKTYDGTTAATLTSATLAGVIAGDTVGLAGGAATFNSPDVAAANTVSVSNMSLTGAQAGDYVLADPSETASAAITPRPITGTITAADKLYDGTTAATLTSRFPVGVINSDDVSLIGGTATFDTAAVGNSKTVTASGFSLTGAKAGDYSLSSATLTTTASIDPLTLSGTVYNDANGDGVRQTSEAGLSGRTVTLEIAGKGTKGEKTAKTDASGNFSFANLAVGSYVLKVTLPAHWKSTTASAAGDSISLQPGAAPASLQFGETNAGNISGLVFLDSNHNGTHQASEAGLAGWTVILTQNGSSTPTFATTTSAGGAYSFSNVPIGAYHVSIVAQTGYSAAAKDKTTYSLNLTALQNVTADNFGQQLGAGVKVKHSKKAA